MFWRTVETTPQIAQEQGLHTAKNDGHFGKLNPEESDLFRLIRSLKPKPTSLFVGLQ
jgi:hypothetical protein